MNRPLKKEREHDRLEAIMLYGLWTRGLLIRRNIADGDLAYIIAWSLWRRAHQAAAQKAHIKSKSQL